MGIDDEIGARALETITLEMTQQEAHYLRWMLARWGMSDDGASLADDLYERLGARLRLPA